MADRKISEENTKTPIDGTELVRLATTGLNWKATLQSIFTALQSTTKQYVDDGDAAVTTAFQSADASKLSKAGGTMTGAITLSGNPSGTLDAAPKQYVDTGDATVTTAFQSADTTLSNSKLNKSGGTMTGALTLAADPSGTLDAATKQYVDTADALRLSKSGGTMTGVLTLSGDPSGTLDAATKQYADTKLSKAGGTMTGIITLSANPTNNLEAATKQYVDGATSGGGVPSGTVMLFVQTTAPTGWTKSTTHNDKALRVVSGTASSGGTNAFSTVFAQTVTGGTSITVANVPSGTFLSTGTNISVSTVQFAIDNISAVTSVTLNQVTAGSGTAHTHPMDIRVQYVDVIIASKD